MSTVSQPPPQFIIDVDDADFDTEVLERSKTTPVVVDFWAPWCGPCRSLGPILEALAEEFAGAFLLVKVNVDDALQVASTYGVRSIPAVSAFRNGEVVSEFVGAQPERVVREFLRSVVPSEADAVTANADELREAGDLDTAEGLYSAALGIDEHHERALFGVARVKAARGDVAGAQTVLAGFVPGAALEKEVDRFAAELRTHAVADVDPEAMRARLKADPDDLDARISLGRALGAAGQHEAALVELLTAVKQDPNYADGSARKSMLDLFAVIGNDHPLTESFRRQLAAALYR